MKILLIGLDCAAPELLLGLDELSTIRGLMEMGAFGRLESVVPPITVPAWMSMATGRDPGTLGVYGIHNRADRSYKRPTVVDSTAITAPAIWDQLALEGKKSVIVGVPPNYPPRKVNGVSVGCFLTPGTGPGQVFTNPLEVGDEIRRLVGDYPVDAKGFRTEDKARLLSDIREMTTKHFEVVRTLMSNTEWDFFQFVEIGLDRMHHGFWKHHDPSHVLHDPSSPYKNVVREYYKLLDEEIASVLELLDDETVVLVASDHGARSLDGGFCVNEWLVKEGYLVLNSYPKQVTKPDHLDVNWSKTKAWSEGGYYARVYLNVKGRESSGAVDPADALKIRDELQAKLEATVDPSGKLLGTLVFKPEEIYHAVNNVAPDLIVHFGALAWRSVGGVGYPSVHVLENDTGPDDCNHAQHGAFLLAAPNFRARGELENVSILDMAPTLLELGGFDVPPGMQGRSIASEQGLDSEQGGSELSDEELIRERLSGLGYIA